MMLGQSLNKVDVPCRWLLGSHTNCQEPDYGIHIDPHVQVQRGLCAHVPCTFTVPTNISLRTNIIGSWYSSRTGQLVAAQGDSTHYTNGRFELIGNVTRGDCSLYIQEPLSTDEGVYFFIIKDPEINFTYTNIQPYVQVTELKDKPSISSTRLVDGKKVTLKCISPGKCRNITTPHFSWEGVTIDSTPKTYKTTYIVSGLRTFDSRMTFTPKKSHNNSTLFCRATFNQGLYTVEKRTLNVEYSPSIYLTSEGSVKITIALTQPGLAVHNS
ncbi:unnamed protein product [Ranitomeya imitator]|uniref:Ig-like domain-containing protein n=1 Tax=Ranitomeya imitator TaxID=111125 RepID=A0ABN9KWL0_9NEOB|nr:unnamed protein product [Ranitomeya imitator]